MSSRRMFAKVFLGAAAVCILGGVLLGTFLGPGRGLRSRAVVKVVLGDALPEEAPISLLGRVLAGERRTFGDLVALFEQAAQDDRVEAIVARVVPSDIGWARLQELRDAMRQFTDKGKILACHAEVLDTQTYFLASACGTIDLPPTGVFSVPGVSAQVEFFKKTLSKLGIEAEMEHVGAYKSASEPLTREDMSPPAREQLDAVLDAIYGTIVSGIAEERHLPPDSLRALLDRGLLSPARARESGLVDDLRYYDEVLDGVKDQIGSRVSVLDEASYLRDVRARRSAGRDRLAVVYATGMIVSGESDESRMLGQMLGSETLSESLASAAEDPSIKAVVLRIDSPGGSGPASDTIWRATQRVREVKPLVVSMGDVAASGGYWIATGADAIVAEPLTVTGSIGVVGGKFYLKPFYDWIGISKEVLKRGRNADLYDDYSRFSDEQRSLVQESMQTLYQQFLARASQGRGMSHDEVDRLAQGRVWTGSEAVKNGLVDEFGGLSVALLRARLLAKIPPGHSVGLDLYPRPRGFLDTLVSLRENRSVAPQDAGALEAAGSLERLLRDRVLALMPYRLILH
jgi:protease IV